MTGTDDKKNQSLIDKLPKRTRKNLKIFIIIILTLIIVSFWLLSLSRTLTPSSTDKKQTENLGEIKNSLSAFLDGTKEQLAVLKNQVKNLADLPEEPTEPELTPETIAKIKDQLLAGEMKNWLSYANNQYQYQIKYPTNWRLDDSDPLITLLTSSSTPDLIHSMNIRIVEGHNLSFESELLKDFPAGCAKSHETIINDNPAIRLRCLEIIDNVNRERENYLIEKDNNLYILSFVKSEKNLNDTILKIITTFEFTPQPKS